jgi:hypothetical protein
MITTDSIKTQIPDLRGRDLSNLDDADQTVIATALREYCKNLGQVPLSSFQARILP